MLAFLLFSIFLSSKSAQSQYLLVKTHLAQIPFGQYGIGIEKVFDKQFSLQLNAQYLPPNKGSNFINRAFADKDELNSSLLEGYAFSLESRAYTLEARSEAWKWYLGFFFRYSQYKTTTDYDKADLNRKLEGSLISASGGIQLGINYIYKNKYSLDVCFMGVGFARNQIDVQILTEEESPNIGRIEDELRQIPILGSRMKLSKNEEGILEFKESYGTLAIRFAVTVGIIL